jgi:hypothetical protein
LIATFVCTGSVSVADAVAPPVPGHASVAVYVDVAALVPSGPVDTETDGLAGSVVFGVTKVPSLADTVQVEPEGTPVVLQLKRADPPSAALDRLDVNDAITGGTGAGVTGTLSDWTSVLPFAPGHCSVTLNGLVNNGTVVTEPPAYVPREVLANSPLDEVSVQAGAVAGSFFVTQASVVVPPEVTVEGLAVNDKIAGAGGGAVTVTDVVALLAIPVHVSVAV